MHELRVKSAVKLETCRAQSLDANLAGEIWRVCQESPEVAACHVLDFHKPDSGDTGIFIVLVLDDPSQMNAVAPRFIAMLERFPPEMHAGRIFVTSSQTFDTSRYSGAEFYVRSVQSHPRTSVQPPVDLDKPVENPELSKALNVYINNQCSESEQELLAQLRGAVFLVPMLADEMKMSQGPEPGVATIEKDSLLKVFACTDRDGAHHLPLFTDRPAVQTWTDQKVSTLVMPAMDAWAFVLSQPHYAGAFINPGSQRLQLNREFVQYLKDAQ